MGLAADNIHLGSDIDAQGEEEDIGSFQGYAPGPATAGALAINGDESDVDAEGSDVDAEGEEVDEEDDEPAYRPTIKLRGSASPRRAGTQEQEAHDVAVESSSALNSETELDSPDDSDESTAEAEWQGESESEAEEAEIEVNETSKCIYCGEDEENDPSEEFEEYLGCTVCGDNAHRQCARENGALTPDTDAVKWRCKSCEENGLQPDTGSQQSASRKSSFSDIDVPSPQPLDHAIRRGVRRSLTNGSAEKGHALRKRRSISEDDEPPQRGNRKRRRISEVASHSTSARGRTESQSPARPRRRNAGSNPRRTDSEPGSPKPRSSRGRRAARGEHADGRLVSLVPDAGLLVLSFKLDSERMQKILNQRPRPRKYYGRDKGEGRPRKKVAAPVIQEPEVPHYPPLPSSYNTSFLFALGDKDQDDAKTKPYGGILTEAEADNSKTFPHPDDRKRFEDARLVAEEDWKKKMMALNATTEPTKPTQKVSGPPSKIKCINFGGFEIDTWHAAPYPEEYSRNRTLYICEFCLKYMNSDYVAWRHKLKCPAKHPPGDEIYRDGSHSFFEVDGRKNPVYCQNLCLLAKLFLGSKTLYYDVEPFLFYVLTENDQFGCHFVGYFSKEKRPSSLNNVSCILTMPIYQRRGFGAYLIEFSYLLTRVEGKTGSPEKPLSDMGLVTYRNYWRLVMCQELLDQREKLSIPELSDRTGMTADDIVSALEGLRALVRDPITKTYALRLDTVYYKEYIEKDKSKKHPKINPDCLIWVPYVMNRNMERHFEEGHTIRTVAQREEDELEQHESEDGAIKEDEEDLALRKTVSNESKKPLLNGLDEKDIDMIDAQDLAVPSQKISPEEGPPSRRSSPRRSPSKPAATPIPHQTPQPDSLTNGASTPTTSELGSMIPPARFEVFPPIPGMSTTKRRAGRPFGSRARTRHGFAARGTPIRRTQSTLVPLANGDGEASLPRRPGRRPNIARAASQGSSLNGITRRSIRNGVHAQSVESDHMSVDPGPAFDVEEGAHGEDDVEIEADGVSDTEIAGDQEPHDEEEDAEGEDDEQDAEGEDEDPED